MNLLRFALRQDKMKAFARLFIESEFMEIISFDGITEFFVKIKNEKQHKLMSSAEFSE